MGRLIVATLLALLGGLRLAPGGGDSERERLAAAAERLRDARPETRRSAVRALAELGTRASWELVLEALEDSDPQVGDEAQLALAGLADERLLAALAGRSGLRAKEPLVRLRAAEVFGRSATGCDGRELVLAVDRREPEVARALLWSIERAARAGRLGGDLERTVRELERESEGRGEPRMRAGALLALAALDGERALVRARATRLEREPDLRAAALLVLGEHAPDEAARVARACLGDEASGVRIVALELLQEFPSREGAAALVERLAVEARPRVAWRLVETLQKLSGLRYRADARPWRLWVERLPADWAGERSVTSGARERLGERTRAFAGLPMLSDRVAFLIDFSGSLWQGQVGGRTRKDVAVEALAKALAGLDASAAFNVVPYTGEPIPWKDRLVPAEPRAVAEAVQWLAACRASGKGNVYDAIQFVLRDPAVDTIVILTDGVPTGGSRWNLDLMVDLLVEQNRCRRVAYDVVLVDAHPGQAKRWERLAQESGGRCVAQVVPAGEGDAAD